MGSPKVGSPKVQFQEFQFQDIQATWSFLFCITPYKIRVIHSLIIDQFQSQSHFFQHYTTKKQHTVYKSKSRVSNVSVSEPMRFRCQAGLPELNETSPRGGVDSLVVGE